MIERRAAERKAFTLPVECDLGVAAGGSGPVLHSAQAQNICEYGVRILIDYPLKKGAVLKLNLPASGYVLPVFAEVAWAIPTDNRYSAGLRFLR
jgi:hypothetical protein